MTQAKKDKIAPISIFFMLYISRIVVSLTNIQSVTTGEMSTDVLISVLLSMGLTLLLSLPALYCYKNNKNPFKIKWVAYFYSVYFVFLAGINISRFAYFASTTLNPDINAWIFCVLIAFCGFYGAFLGIEGIGRFSAFAFSLLVLAVAVVIAFSIKNYEEINFYPVIVNDTSSILKNVLYMTSNSFEMIVLVCLYDKVNGNGIKTYVWSVIAAFFTLFLLVLMVIGVMGNASALQTFPLFSLFQLAKTGIFERLDILHISFWIMGVFVKSVILIYCTSLCFKKGKNNVKCAAGAFASMIVAIIFSGYIQLSDMPLSVYLVPFGFFCVLIPLLTLAFKKKNLGDELIEKF